MAKRKRQIQKPVLRATLDLRERGGEYDAGLQLLELAISHLQEAAKNASTSQREFITSMARKHHLTVGADSLAQARRFASETAIVQLHSVFDSYLLSLIKEHISFAYTDPDDWTRRDGKAALPPLQQLASNLSRSEAADFKKLPEFAIAEYYRNVRNDIVHNQSRTRAETRRQHNALTTQFRKHILAEYGWDNVPNLIHGLDLCDARFFSRVIHVFAVDINNTFGPTIAQIVDKTIKNRRILALGKDKLGRHDSFNSAMIRVYRTGFGFNHALERKFAAAMRKRIEETKKPRKKA